MTKDTEKMLEFLSEHSVLALSDCQGSCPCGELYIRGLHIDFHCWRSSQGCECKYSGLHVYCHPDWQYDLKVIGEKILEGLEERWGHTEWNLSFEPRK